MRRLATAGLLLAALGSSAGDEPVRLTRDGFPKHRPAWSPDGKTLAYARQEDGGLHIRQYVQEIGSSAPARRLTARKEPEYDAIPSPDGKKYALVIVTLSGTQGNLDVAVANADGSELKALPIDKGMLAHQEWPNWSPDGKKLAFSSTHEGNQEIYTSDLDGSNLTRITQHNGIDAHPCWTADGKGIIFSTDRWGGMELARANADGSGTVRLTRSPGLDDYPAVSPDGKRLAFTSNRDGRFEIFVSRIDGSEPRPVSRGASRDTFPVWTPDGKGITFVSNRASEGDVFTARVPD